MISIGRGGAMVRLQFSKADVLPGFRILNLGALAAISTDIRMN